MEILFLGTSSGWPLPRLGCNCNICSSKDSKDVRLRPSLLINNHILIDASPDIYHELFKYSLDPTQITHLLITHAHDDHIMGLYDLSHIYNLNQKITLLTTSGIFTQIRKKFGTSLASFKFQEAKPGIKIDIEADSNIWYIPVVHGAVEAYAIKVKAPKPIVYAPEFRKIVPSSRKFLGDLDLAIIDGSSKTSYGQARGHETIEDGVRFGKAIKAKKILFTNIGHKTDTHQKLVEFVKQNGGKKFGISYDGLRIKL
jgi:phosphoribosyl 1,2-cyclic phosphate phosphodiesterase